MKTIRGTSGKLLFNKDGVGLLHKKTQKWISEIEFVKIEQEFFKVLLSEHIIEFCNSQNLESAKKLLNEIEDESKLGDKLIHSIYDQRMNLSLVSENIYIKKDVDFRSIQKRIKTEFIAYRDKFKEIKSHVFELVLDAVKKEKQKRLLA